MHASSYYGADGALTSFLMSLMLETLVPQQPSGQVRLERVTTAGITLLHAQEVPMLHDHGKHMAGYCTALWGALPRLRSLELEWPPEVQLLQHLPSVSAFQQLSSLHLGKSFETGSPVQLQWLLQAVQGATQLQELRLLLDFGPSQYTNNSRRELVEGLQQVLPGLTFLGLRGGEEGLASADLRPGLKLGSAW